MEVPLASLTFKGKSPTTVIVQFNISKSVVLLAAKVEFAQAPFDSTTKDVRKSLPPKLMVATRPYCKVWALIAVTTGGKPVDPPQPESNINIQALIKSFIEKIVQFFGIEIFQP